MLSDFFDRRLLPAIPVGPGRTEVLKDGVKRRRRVGKWIVPREAFIRAWQNFTVPDLLGARRGKRNAA